VLVSVFIIKLESTSGLSLTPLISSVPSFNFRATAPAFSNTFTYPDARIQAQWDLATAYLSDNTAIGCYNGMPLGQQTSALNLMTAHLMALNAAIAAGQPTGVLTGATIDKVSVQLQPPPDENQWQFDLMQRFNDYLLRGITENNSVNSFVTVNEFIKMLSKLVEQEKKKPENQGKSNEELLQQVVKNGSNGSAADQKKFQRALDQAKKNIEEKQQQVEQASGLQAGKSDTPFDFKEIDQLLDFANLVKHMPLNHKFVANFVNQSLKFSSGYFSNSYKQYEESILDSDVVDNIENFEELLPVYKNLNIEDLMTNYRKYNLSFDIFIDNSGSMDSSYRFDGKSVSGFDLCKIMALKLNNMKLVKDVYLFNDSYKKVNNLNEIFKLRTSGGTQIDKVVQYVNSTGRPAVVLTDMQDTVYNHSINIFFIGILDARFNFRESAIKFGTNKQCVRFNENGTFTKVYQK